MKNDWELKDFAEVVYLQEGPGIRKYEYEEGGFPMINVRCVQDGYVDMSKGRAANMELANTKWKHFQIDEGDILFTISGTIGRAAIVKKEDLPLLMNTSVVRFKSIYENLDSAFLYHYVRSSIFVDALKAMSTGTAIQNVGPSHLKKMKVPIPPLQEQKQIVKILDEAFAAIDQAKANIEKNIENAKELFQSKLNEIFSLEKEIDGNKGFLEDFTQTITKGSSPKWQGVSYLEEPGILFVTSENVGSGEMLFKKTKYLEERFNEIEPKSKLQKGDVLTNIVGASIGRTAIYDQNDLANINQAVCLIRCLPEKLNNEYLMHLLNSPILKRIMSDNEVNMARANLSLTFFRKLPIVVPSIEEQLVKVQEIAKFSELNRKLINGYNEKVNNLNELKKSILQKAFSGELTDKTVET